MVMVMVSAACMDDVCTTVVCWHDGTLSPVLPRCSEHLPLLGGYLIEAGTINFRRLQALTSFMGSLEEATLQKREAEARKFARRHGGGRCALIALC